MISLIGLSAEFYLVHNFETSQTHPENLQILKYPLPVFVRFFIYAFFR
jgi:hypothetical protein